MAVFPHHDHIHNLTLAYIRFGCQHFSSLVDGLNQALLQELSILMALIGKGNAADHIFAKSHLRVHHPGAGQRGASFQVNQIESQLGGSHIHRQTGQCTAAHLGGYQTSGVRFAAQCYTYFPFLPPQSFG